MKNSLFFIIPATTCAFAETPITQKGRSNLLRISGTVKDRPLFDTSATRQKSCSKQLTPVLSNKTYFQGFRRCINVEDSFLIFIILNYFKYLSTKIYLIIPPYVSLVNKSDDDLTHIFSEFLRIKVPFRNTSGSLLQFIPNSLKSISFLSALVVPFRRSCASDSVDPDFTIDQKQILYRLLTCTSACLQDMQSIRMSSLGQVTTRPSKTGIEGRGVSGKYRTQLYTYALVKVDTMTLSIFQILPPYKRVLFFRTKLYSSDCPYAITISKFSRQTVIAARFINFNPRISFGFSRLRALQNLVNPLPSTRTTVQVAGRITQSCSNFLTYSYRDFAICIFTCSGENYSFLLNFNSYKNGNLANFDSDIFIHRHYS